MEEVQQVFEHRHRIKLKIIYSGSKTILKTIQKTGKGDVFVTGAFEDMEELGTFNFIERHHFIAFHTPIFAFRKDNPRDIQSLEDLAGEGIRIAVGNKDMCAISEIGEGIMAGSNLAAEFQENIYITGSTVNELLYLVVQGEADVAIIWRDMLLWPSAKEVSGIEIPAALNQIKEVHAIELTVASNKKSAALFADFMATEGKAIFYRNGFGGK
jgi:molybdate transport system substrate-binding protein